MHAPQTSRPLRCRQDGKYVSCDSVAGQQAWILRNKQISVVTRLVIKAITHEPSGVQQAATQTQWWRHRCTRWRMHVSNPITQPGRQPQQLRARGFQCTCISTQLGGPTRGQRGDTRCCSHARLPLDTISFAAGRFAAVPEPHSPGHNSTTSLCAAACEAARSQQHKPNSCQPMQRMAWRASTTYVTH